MMGMQVQAAGHRCGALSATVRAASLAVHDERPGQGAGQKPSHPAAGQQPAPRATPANAVVLVNDAWRWERAQPRIGLGADEAARGGAQAGGLPAWHRVRGAVLEQEGPFAQPAARLARHSSFRWDLAAPSVEPLGEHHDLDAPSDWQAAPPRRGAAAAGAGGDPLGPALGPAEILHPAPSADPRKPLSMLREATPAASRAGSEVGGAGAASDDGVQEAEDGFLLEYVLHGMALGPARGPQVRAGHRAAPRSVQRVAPPKAPTSLSANAACLCTMTMYDIWPFLLCPPHALLCDQSPSHSQHWLGLKMHTLWPSAQAKLLTSHGCCTGAGGHSTGRAFASVAPGQPGAGAGAGRGIQPLCFCALRQPASAGTAVPTAHDLMSTSIHVRLPAACLVVGVAAWSRHSTL